MHCIDLLTEEGHLVHARVKCPPFSAVGSIATVRTSVLTLLAHLTWLTENSHGSVTAIRLVHSTLIFVTVNFILYNDSRKVPL